MIELSLVRRIVAMVKSCNEQLNLLDIMNPSDFNKITSDKEYNTEPIPLTDEIIETLNCYNLETYIKNVKEQGLQTTWDNICQYAIDNYNNLPNFLDINNFGELYEIGLAIQDKQQKKDNGQYYTPDDVATVMSNWLKECEGENICDVACGTGKLILTYLDLIGYEKARALISAGKLYLYDFDNIALKICRTTIGIKYGLDIINKINDIYCDFLDRSIILPQNSKVISNPPYAQITDIQNYWEHTNVALDTKEYYAIFMEKILKQSRASVIISPYSFISGNKFYSLRKEMNNHTGFIVSFDNVPGNIFCGRKHGIFNTNTSNSVRAAITVTNRNKQEKGYRLTPLIRFKQTERKDLLINEILEEFLNPNLQLINEQNPMFYKCDKRLSHVFDTWKEKSNGWILLDYIKEKGEYSISMPNTCRYYTTAAANIMNRSGQITLNFNDKNVFNYIYCLINSSFVYWYWRIYDGGITYPKSLLLNIPVFYELLTDSDFKFFEDMTTEMIKKSKNYIITKNNVGTQENIKYPREYRDKINKKFFKILN
ncbi:MAG: SAM-dependent methyltransferase, partial [Candidatus Gastranaerophilales bacterium]|nr:SAM-dependent methyltransferase [Candidatus Gastranaerophilales bacterium]